MKKLNLALVLLGIIFLISCSPTGNKPEPTAIVVAPTQPPVIVTATPEFNVTPGFIVISDDAKVSRNLANVEGVIAQISVEERILILTGGGNAIDSSDLYTAEVLLASDSVPYATELRKTPCYQDSFSSPNYLTQYFNWNPSMDWRTTVGYHPGVDIVCSGGNGAPLLALADGLVVARYFIPLPNNQETITYWSSGITIIAKTNVSRDKINIEVLNALNIQAEYVPMIFVVGHMLEGGAWPQPGEVIKAGIPIGEQGDTGRVTGTHAHVGWFIEMSDGTLYAIDFYNAFNY